MTQDEARVNQKLVQLLANFSATLDKVGIDQSLSEVELIFCHVLGVDRLTLYLHGDKLIQDTHLVAIEEIIENRRTRYPLQYILGESWFYGRRFVVSPAVMVPTPETELLCETALRIVRSHETPHPRIIDLGVGSGVIAVTLACEVDNCMVTALDVSPEAIAVARQNARAHGCLGKIEFRESEFFSAIGPDERFDLILSNPPYIRESDYESLPPEVLADPQIALVSGPEGLDAIEIIIREAPQYLAPGGRIMFEIGPNQVEPIVAEVESDRRYSAYDIVKDLNERDRLVILSCHS